MLKMDEAYQFQLFALEIGTRPMPISGKQVGQSSISNERPQRIVV